MSRLLGSYHNHNDLDTVIIDLDKSSLISNSKKTQVCEEFNVQKYIYI